MDQNPIWVVFMMLILLFSTANSDDKVNQALVQFMRSLSPGNASNIPNWGWNSSSDACSDKWYGIKCKSASVQKIVLNKLNLTGTIDVISLCVARSLAVLSLENNRVLGGISTNISNCKHLTHMYLTGNKLSGSLPESLAQLSNLKRFDISDNELSGELPANLSRISGLITLLVQDNQFSGNIPNLDFSNLAEFNVSNNNFSGSIPVVKGRFNASCFLGNPGLCGKPLSKICPIQSPTTLHAKEKRHSAKQYLMYSGYAILGLIILLLISLKLMKKKKPKHRGLGAVKSGVVQEGNNSSKTGGMSSEINTRGSKSEYSTTSAESGMASSALVVLASPVEHGLKFHELLQAPAELIGKGRHGSLYKVILYEGRLTLAVKRIKDWKFSKEDFKKRMQKIDQLKHPHVLPLMAYYCSKQEKLLVYEYQQNGSLFSLLHGSQNGHLFDWGIRVKVAAKVAEALAYMHRELHDDRIAHGNLKSSNILLNKDMKPCISEYGHMVVENQDHLSVSQSNSLKNRDPTGGRTYSTFKVDIYAFGVILLELLTGKLVQNNGIDLARWVHSVVREEWTVEVFDKILLSEGANEGRMMNLLQVALQCINPSPDARPSINQVAVMINSIQEEEDKSISSEQ